MKKITALILALVMTLSLLPMTVWATTGTLPVNTVDFYLKDESGNVTTDGLSINNSLLVNFESGKGVTLYMKPSVAGETIRVTGGNLAPGEVLDTSKAIFTAPGTENGYYTLALTTAVTENCSAYVQRFNGENPVQNGGIDIQFFAQSSGGSNQGDNDQPTGETFTAKGIYIFNDMDQGILHYRGGLKEEGGVVTVPCGEGGAFLFLASGDDLTKVGTAETPWPDSVKFAERTENPTTWNGLKLYEMNIDGQASGKVNATITGIGINNENLAFRFDFDPQQGGDNQEYLRSNTPVIPADILPTSAMPDNFETAEGFGKVQIPGTDYFMSLIRSSEDVLQDVKIDGMGIPERAQDSSEFAIGFWKRDGQQWLLLEGTELTNLVDDFNDTLNIGLKLYTDDANNAAEIEYPYTRFLDEAGLAISPYPHCAEYVFNHHSQGHWLVVVSGTYKGEYVESLAYLNREEQIVRGIDATGMDTVDQINEAIDTLITGLPENFTGRIAVDLPATTLEGYIVVPSCQLTVMLSGQKDANGNLETVLKGGIIANNSFCRVENVRFTGAGRNVTTGNYAISGTGSGGFENCSFTGYHYAIYLTNGIAAGKDNFFYNNNVGYRVDDPDVLAIGNHEIYNTVFAYNGTDIEIDNVDNTAGGPRYYKIWDTIFIGSEQNVSVDDTLREILFMPKNAFDDGPLTVGASRVDEPKIEGKVSATPYYGLSPEGRDALHRLQDANVELNANYYLAHPTFNDDWIDHGKKFNSEWMCPERPDDRDVYNVPSDEIKKHHDHGHNMTIKMMGDRGNGHECVATITLKPAAGN